MQQSNEAQQRYQRQVMLAEWGIAGQQKMAAARVLVTGAGGLGCPALQYLAAAGIGTIGIVDDDIVAETNLHRQLLYTPADIGMLKVTRAAEVLQQLNPACVIHTYPVHLSNSNAWDIIRQYDLVIDGTDNFATRYLINDACVLLSKPLVYGSVFRFEGQVAVFNLPGETPAANYRDLFPQPPAPHEVPSCAEAGVLGVIPGIIGTMQACEAMKIITGIGLPLQNQLLTYNALYNQWYQADITPQPLTPGLMPGDAAAFEQWDYNSSCSPVTDTFTTIQPVAFEALRRQKNVRVLDVRETGEQPAVHQFAHEQLPLSRLLSEAALVKGETIIVFCQSGQRSVIAAGLLAAANTVFNLQGGITGWLTWQSSITQTHAHR